jgi:hypothetical protein
MPDFGISGHSPIKHSNVGLGDEAPKPKLERQNGGRMEVPEGLTARASTGGAAPRQPLKLGGEKLKPDAQTLKPDAETQEAIDSQKQQSANAAALAKATAEAAGQQALMEHLKSMAEMQAKSIKSGGDLLKGLT